MLIAIDTASSLFGGGPYRLEVQLPAFPAGERHELFVHAQGKDEQWCPYKKITINPNVGDILDEIQSNYSAMTDVQYDVSFTERVNGISNPARTATVKMKGPYKLRMQYDNGLVSIQNENRLWTFDSTSNSGEPVMTKGLDGEFSVAANRTADFFWDVPMSKIRSDVVITNSSSSTAFNAQITPKGGMLYPAQSFSFDPKHKIVTQLETKVGDVLMRSEYLFPMEMFAGHWLFTVHRHTMQFDSGDQLVMESSLSNIRVNQGLADSLFDIPTE